LDAAATNLQGFIGACEKWWMSEHPFYPLCPYSALDEEQWKKIAINDTHPVANQR